MRIALTGAATGIGAEVAARLKARGHEVTAFDIVEPENNVDRWIRTDLADPASIQAAIDAADGPFEGLVNNAGLPPQTDAGSAERVLKVNFLGFRQFLDAMLPRLSTGAAIVNTASRAGANWRENLQEVNALHRIEHPEELSEFIREHEIDATRAYNLSKEAIIALTKARTEEMIKRGFRMNSVSPSAVSTGIIDDFYRAFGEQVVRNVARVGRPGKPGEVADVILFLLGSESHWLKGIDIVVDGGMNALQEADQLGLG